MRLTERSLFCLLQLWALLCPSASFTDLGLPHALLQVLHRRGITEPLPVQSAIIPDALEGRDVSGMAPTGSGKTLAFALPMAALVSRGLPKRPRGLVLAPTRELAAQIAGELAPFLATRNLKVHAIFGGSPSTPSAAPFSAVSMWSSLVPAGSRT